MENHNLKIILGCLLAATLLAGCEKNAAPQATGATGLAPLAAQATGTNPAAGQKPSTALSDEWVVHLKENDAKFTASGCSAAFNAAMERRASDEEFDKIARSKMCN